MYRICWISPHAATGADIFDQVQVRECHSISSRLLCLKCFATSRDHQWSCSQRVFAMSPEEQALINYVLTIPRSQNAYLASDAYLSRAVAVSFVLFPSIVPLIMGWPHLALPQRFLSWTNGSEICWWPCFSDMSCTSMFVLVRVLLESMNDKCSMRVVSSMCLQCIHLIYTRIKTNTLVLFGWTQCEYHA